MTRKLPRIQTASSPSALAAFQEIEQLPVSEHFTLTVHDVAQYFAVRHTIVRREARRKKLEGKKFGGQWRFSPAAVSRYLAAQMDAVGKT